MKETKENNRTDLHTRHNPELAQTPIQQIEYLNEENQQLNSLSAESISMLALPPLLHLCYGQVELVQSF